MYYRNYNLVGIIENGQKTISKQYYIGSVATLQDFLFHGINTWAFNQYTWSFNLIIDNVFEDDFWCFITWNYLLTLKISRKIAIFFLNKEKNK